MEVGLSSYTPRKPDIGNPYKLMEKLDANENGKLSKSEIEESKLGRVIGENFGRVDKNEDGGISSDELFEFREAQREERREARGPSQQESVTAALVATLTELTETLSELVEQQFGVEEGEGDVATAKGEVALAEGEANLVPSDIAALAENATDAAIAAVQAAEDGSAVEFAAVDEATVEEIAAAEQAALQEAAEASEADALGAATSLAEAARDGLSSQEIVLSLFQSIIEAVGDSGDREEAPELAQSLYSEMQSLLGDTA